MEKIETQLLSGMETKRGFEKTKEKIVELRRHWSG
jgi:hypothetical protein